MPLLFARTNFATNPSYEVGVDSIQSSNGTNYVISADTTAPIYGTRSALLTRAGTLSTTIGAFIGVPTTDRMPVTPGSPVTGGLTIKSDVANTTVATQWFWYDSVGALTAGTSTTRKTGLAANTTFRAVEVGTPPANMVTARFVVIVTTASGNAVVGQRVWGDMLTLENGTTDGSYFDGSTPAAGGVTYSWTGAANASNSIASDWRTRTNRATNPRAVDVGASSGWSAGRLSGPGGVAAYSYQTGIVGPAGTGITTCRRKTWTTASTSSNGSGFDVLAAASPNTFFPITLGVTYTVSAWLRYSSATSKNGQLELAFRNTPGSITENPFPAAVQFPANTWTRFEFTWTPTVAGGVGMQVVADIEGANPWQVGETLDCTGVLIEAAAGPAKAFFDGDSSIGVTSWTGTVNASMSTATEGQIAAWVTSQARTNRMTNPRAVGSGVNAWSSGRWFGLAPGAGTYTYATDAVGHPLGITTCRRKTWTVATASNGDTGLDIHANMNVSYFPVTPGETITASVWLKATSATSKTHFMRLYFYNQTTNAGAVQIGAIVNGPNNTIPAGTGWFRLSLTAVVPAGAYAVRVIADVTPVGSPGTWDVGDTLEGTACLIEQSPGPGDYFDGTTTDTSTDRYDWTGTANSSSSTLTGIAPRNLRQAYQGTALVTPPARINRVLNPRAVAGTGDDRWKARWYGAAPAAGTTTLVTGLTGHPNGITTGLRKTWTVSPLTNGDTGFEVYGKTVPSNQAVPVTGGETLTLSGWLRHTSTTDKIGHAQIVGYQDLAMTLPTSPTSLQSPDFIIAPNTWVRVSVTWTIPANMVGAKLLLDIDNPGSGNANLWQPGETLEGTGCMLESGSSLSTYRDGDSGQGWFWEGARNNALSVGWA